MQNMLFKEIIKEITEKKINLSLIRSPTGSGKSTLMILELLKLDMKVFVVSPTIPSVMNLYNYMKDYVDNIGYSYDSNICYNNLTINKIRKIKKKSKIESKLVYCTYNHLKNLLYDCYNSKYDNVSFCDYIILDEIHLGTIEIVTIERLWKIINGCKLLSPLMIQSSATYYNENITTYEIFDENNYDVEVIYLNQNPSNMLLEIIYLLNSFENDIPDENVWLVFLSGISEIEFVKNKLKKCYDIFIAHSSSNVSEIFNSKFNNKRKIILSTNIFETSLTIKNCSLIIDSLLEKVPFETSFGDIELIECKISKSSAKQRKGRTGRNCHGKVLRMCTEDEYNKLDENKSLEIHRLSLHNEFIKCMFSNININDIFYDIDNKKITKTLNELTRLNIINDNKITDIGRFIVNLPISYKTSLFLYYWNERNLNMYSGIVICMLIEMSDKLIKENFLLGSTFPFEGLVNIWNIMCSEYSNIDISNNNIENYCMRYNINYSAFIELKDKIFYFLTLFSKRKYNVDPFIINIEEIYKDVKEILQIIYPIYIKKKNKKSFVYDKIAFQLDEKYLSYDEEEKIIGIKPKRFGNTNKLLLWIPI